MFFSAATQIINIVVLGGHVEIHSSAGEGPGGSISGWTLRTVKENFSLKTDVCDLYGNNSALILSQELVSDMLSVFE